MQCCVSSGDSRVHVYYEALIPVTSRGCSRAVVYAVPIPAVGSVPDTRGGPAVQLSAGTGGWEISCTLLADLISHPSPQLPTICAGAGALTQPAALVGRVSLISSGSDRTEPEPARRTLAHALDSGPGP